MQRLLGNHDDCTLHNTASKLEINHQQYEFTRKLYAVDESNPFYHGGQR